MHGDSLDLFNRQLDDSERQWAKDNAKSFARFYEEKTGRTITAEQAHDMLYGQLQPALFLRELNNSRYVRRVYQRLRHIDVQSGRNSELDSERHNHSRNRNLWNQTCNRTDAAGKAAQAAVQPSGSRKN